MSTPKPNHQWDVSRLYKNVRTRLRIQQIHMWSWSCDSKASIQMSDSSKQSTSNINELLTQIDCNPTKSYAHLWPWAWGQWPLICQHQLTSSDLTGCKRLHPGQSLRKGYDWSGWCHVLSRENSGTFLFTHVHWLQRSPNEVHWNTDFCLITWSHNSSDIGYRVNYWLVVNVHSHSMCVTLYCPIH